MTNQFVNISGGVRRLWCGEKKIPGQKKLFFAFRKSLQDFFCPGSLFRNSKQPWMPSELSNEAAGDFIDKLVTLHNDTDKSTNDAAFSLHRKQ